MAVLWLQTSRQGLHLQVQTSIQSTTLVVLNRDELKLHLSSGVLTRLDVSFSRLRKDEIAHVNEQVSIDHESRTESYDVGNKYVQDNIRLKGAHIVSWIVKDHATVYVCG